MIRYLMASITVPRALLPKAAWNLRVDNQYLLYNLLSRPRVLVMTIKILGTVRHRVVQ